jgi:hypothetical protein
MKRLEAFIAWLSPTWAWRRQQAREALKQLQTPTPPKPTDGDWARWDEQKGDEKECSRKTKVSKAWLTRKSR